MIESDLTGGGTGEGHQVKVVVVSAFDAVTGLAMIAVGWTGDTRIPSKRISESISVDIKEIVTTVALLTGENVITGDTAFLAFHANASSISVLRHICEESWWAHVEARGWRHKEVVHWITSDWIHGTHSTSHFTLHGGGPCAGSTSGVTSNAAIGTVVEPSILSRTVRTVRKFGTITGITGVGTLVASGTNTGPVS